MARSNRASRLKAGQALPMTYPTPRVTPIVTKVVFVLDESGSMLGKGAETGFNDFLMEQRTQNPSALMTLVTFNFTSRVRYVETPITMASVLGTLGTQRYIPSGSTSLHEAVGDAINSVSHVHPNERVLFVILTDGQENSSRRYNRHDIKRLIADRTATGQWTFVYLGTGHDVYSVTDDLGIVRGNTITFDNSYVGTQSAYTTTRGATMSYTASPMMASTTFFAETDASKLTPSIVQTALTNVSSKYSSHTVAAEERIDSFVQRTTRRAYVPGTAFYALTKPEKVQAYKEILLQEKNGRNLYAGADARQLLGLPTHANAKVTPGNHGNWNIYVQSNSVNRKLVRGTKVLVRK